MTAKLSLKELEDLYTKKIKAVDYSKIVDELIKELHKRDIKVDKRYLDAIITSIRASNNVPLSITHKVLKDKETALARAIAIQHKHDTIEEQVEASKIGTKYRFSGDKLTSLEDIFGKIQPEESTGDFLTFLKDGETKPSVIFRGSVTNVKDPRFKGDWSSNFGTVGVDNQTAIQRDNELKRVFNDLSGVEGKYGGFKEFAGYSRGGYLAYRLAKSFNVGTTTTFNPHLTPFFKVGLDLPKGTHTLIRTVGDVASAPYAFIQSKGIKYKSIGEIDGLDTNDLLDSHNLRNFTTDNIPRTLFNKEALNVLTLGRNLVAKGKARDALRARRPKGAFKFEEQQPLPEERYTGLITRNEDRVKGQQAFTSKVRTTTTTRGTETSPSEGTELELIQSRIPPPQQRFPSVPEEGFTGIEQPLPAYQQAVRTHLNSQITKLNSGIKGYTIRGLRTAGSTILKPSNIAGLGAGLVVGEGLSAIETATGLKDKISEPVNDAIVGGLSGAAGTSAAIKLGGQALKTIASGTRVAGSVLGGGVGLVVGDAVTNSVGNLFSPDANPYAKHIISNVVGGEVGTVAGIATEELARQGIKYAVGALGKGASAAGEAGAEAGGEVAGEVGGEVAGEVGGEVAGEVGAVAAETGVEAGLATAAAGEAAAVAADSWNPTVIAPIVALALTGIAAGVVGIFQGGQDEWQKQQIADAQADYNKSVNELNYAGKALTVRGQYKGIRDYLQSLGSDPNTIGKLNNDLIDRLQSGAKQLSPQELSDKFSTYLNSWHQPSNLTKYSGGEVISQHQQLKTAIQRRSLDNLSVLNSLTNRLNKAGANVKAPPKQLYSPQTYAQQYNAILDKAGTKVTSKLGINKLTVPAHQPGLDTQQVISSIPSNLDAVDTASDEVEIQSKITPTKTQQQIGSVVTDIEDPFKAIGTAIHNLVMNNKSTPQETPATVPKKPANVPLAPKVVK